MTDAQSARGDAQSARGSAQSAARGARSAALATRLRAAGCVFAAEEAAILVDAARDVEQLEEMTARRCAGEPLEHVVGKVRFGSIDLHVGPGVFIPRQRSLLLAQVAAEVLRRRHVEHPVVVEAFCGVAPIAAAVAEAAIGARIHVVDVDAKALDYARRNLPAGAHAHLGDGLSTLPPRLLGAVDVIATVPPYIPDGAVELLPHETEYEPRTALLGGSDGLDHIRPLVGVAPEWLADGGALLMEMNTAQAGQILAERSDDWADADRIVGDDGQTAVVRLVRRSRAQG